MDLENAVRRGDEFYDQLETQCSEHEKEKEKLNLEISQKDEAIENLADRLRKRDAENLRLMLLLNKAGIDFQEVE